MKKQIRIVVAIIIVLVACSGENGGEPDSLENSDPGAVDVVGPGEGESASDSTSEEPKPPAAKSESDASSAAPTDPKVTILANGIVRSVLPEFVMTFETAGRLRDVFVRVGDYVTAGHLLASLDDKIAMDRIAEAELNLESAELSLASLAGSDLIAKANLESAEAAFAGARARLESLLTGGDDDAIELARLNLEQVKNNLINVERERDASAIQSDTQYAQKQLDLAVLNAKIAVQVAEIRYRQSRDRATIEEIATAEASVLAANAQVVAARAGVLASDASPSADSREVAVAKIEVERARMALDNARENLDQLHVFAPGPAVVTAVHTIPERTVGAGVPIVTLFNYSLLEFHTTNVTEREIANIVPGLAAVVTVKSYPEIPIESTVSRVGVQPGVPIGDSATFPVIIELNADELDLRPGMTGRAEIEILSS